MCICLPKVTTTGEGAIDFKSEQYKLRLVAHSKRASLIALRGPIRVGGTFERPTVHPEVGPVAARLGAATALGVLVTPVAAWPPTRPATPMGMPSCSPSSPRSDRLVEHPSQRLVWAPA